MARVSAFRRVQARQVDDRQNSFGFLRLLFASLVILSHTSELRYGDRSHEPLARLLGGLSFGDLAVDAFFLVSGYLIVGSYLKCPSPLAFLTKRVGRIYPAFAVASLFAVLVVAPLAGAAPADVLAEGAKTLKRILFLQPPAVPGAFANSPYAVLDGAMWTISYEFRCYLIVLALGVTGALRRPLLIASLAALSLLAFEAIPQAAWHQFDERFSINLLFGESGTGARLTGIFLVGALFYLWRSAITFTGMGVFLASTSLAAYLTIPSLAEPAFAVLGGYLIFGFANWKGLPILTRVNNRDDISYGVYLYAWPLEQLLLLHAPGVPLVVAGLATLLAASLCGWASWRYVEKPAMGLVSRRSPRGGNSASNGNAPCVTPGLLALVARRRDRRA